MVFYFPEEALIYDRGFIAQLPPALFLGLSAGYPAGVFYFRRHTLLLRLQFSEGLKKRYGFDAEKFMRYFALIITPLCILFFAEHLRSTSFLAGEQLTLRTIFSPEYRIIERKDVEGIYKTYSVRNGKQTKFYYYQIKFNDGSSLDIDNEGNKELFAKAVSKWSGKVVIDTKEN